MFVILDNQEENELKISAWVNNKLVQRNYGIRKNNDFLSSLAQFLSDQQSTVNDLKGVGVKMGMGRFTATRLLVTMINALSFSLNIPVVRMDPGMELGAAFSNISQAKVGEYILPIYSSEPHISSK